MPSLILPSMLVQVVALSGTLYVFARGLHECYLHSFDTHRNTWTRLADLRSLRNSEGWQVRVKRTRMRVCRGRRGISFTQTFSRDANAHACIACSNSDTGLAFKSPRWDPSFVFGLAVGLADLSG